MRPGKVKTLMKTFYCFCFPGERGKAHFLFIFIVLSFFWLGVASLVFFEESTQAQTQA